MAKKVQIFQDSVQYLGHRIDKEGIYPVEEKIVTITAAKPPTSLEQLQSFLGMVNYYGKFMPNLATCTTQQIETQWKWMETEEKTAKIASSISHGIGSLQPRTAIKT